MARKSLRHRTTKYKARASEQAARIKASMTRIAARLAQGVYPTLTFSERKNIEGLLQVAGHRVGIVGRRPVVMQPACLKELKQAYYEVLRVLRIAGNRAPIEELSSAPLVIRRSR